MSRTEPLRVVALNGGLRSPSSTGALVDVIVRAVVGEVARRGDLATTRVIEIRDHALDATRALLDGARSDDLTQALEAVRHADLLVVATPVYNGSYAGPFKTFTDLLSMDALAGTPVVLAATGGSHRHTLAVDHELRPLFTVLQASAVPTGVYSTGPDWRSPGVPSDALAARVDRAAWEAVSLASSRPSRT